MSLLALAGTNSATGGYDIENSLKLEDDNTEWLSKTTSSDWNRVKWTASFWVKRGELGATSSNVRFFAASDSAYDFRVRFQGTGDTLAFYNSDSTGSCSQNSTAVFRDTSAWYHIVAVWDTANATAGNRQRLYVNGVEITDFATDTQPAQNQKSVWGKTDDGSGTVTMGIGAQYNYYSGFVQGYCGYMAEWHWVEGQALDPTAFGEVDEDTGIWKPKKYTGTYGTNGFYLDFEDASDLGADASGNGNNWTKNNITSANQATDSPTNNFCTFNAISVVGTSTYTEGGTVAQANKQNDQGEGTIMFSSGNWYFEMQVPSSSASSDAMFGFAIPNEWGPSNPGDDSGKGFSAHNVGRWYYNNNGHTSTDSSTAFAKGDIVSLAINTSSEKAWVAINGTWATGTDPATGTGGFSYGTLLTSWESGSYLVPAFRTHYVSGSKSNANFGGFTAISISTPATDENGYGTFEYAPPTGFYALCTKNLEEYG
jgi:hypothetical protein